ncbi:hypothetical protein [Oerskovia turbata]
MGELPVAGRQEPGLDAYRRRIGRLHDDTGPVGVLVTRVCTHWETVGPHSFPSYVNPEERLQWRVRFDDPARADAFSDDPDLRGADGDGRVLDDWACGRIDLAGEALRIEWLDGEEAASAWQAEDW